MTMGILEGRVAVVSGAASGIGRAAAELLAEEGATVLGADVQAGDGLAYPVRAVDVRREEAWADLIAEAESLGGPDILVNVAGTTGWQGVHELDLAEWDRIIGVNQTGTMLGMKRGIAAMLRHGRGGSVVNIASIFSTRGVENLAAYHASKAAVVGMTRNAAVTYADRGIRVNAIQPGWIATPMTASQASELNDAFIADTPMRRGGEPRDIAEGVLYLASPRAGFVTGAVLPIDGGYLAR